jgi:hypothetical protein
MEWWNHDDHKSRRCRRLTPRDVACYALEIPAVTRRKVTTAAARVMSLVRSVMMFAGRVMASGDMPR